MRQQHGTHRHSVTHTHTRTPRNTLSHPIPIRSIHTMHHHCHPNKCYISLMKYTGFFFFASSASLARRVHSHPSLWCYSLARSLHSIPGQISSQMRFVFCLSIREYGRTYSDVNNLHWTRVPLQPLVPLSVCVCACAAGSIPSRDFSTSTDASKNETKIIYIL